MSTVWARPYWTPSRIETDPETYCTYLDTLIENSPIAIIVLDAQHRFQICNPAFEDLFQYDRECLSVSSVDELLAPPGGAEGVQKVTRDVLCGHKVHEITRRRRGDGEIIEVELYGVPLMVQGTIRGVYGLYQDITARSRAESTVRLLSHQLMRLQEEERRRVARDLHDSTSQEFAVLNINLQRLERMVERNDPRTRKLLSETLSLAVECSQKIRATSYLLHPPLLEESGLQNAVLWLVQGFTERSGIRVNLKMDALGGRIRQEIELALFRIVQESLANVLRHSGSPDVDVELRCSEAAIHVTIADHGRGMAEDLLRRKLQAAGVGITGMRERIEQLGGYLSIASSAQGTSVSAIFPVGLAYEESCENCA